MSIREIGMDVLEAATGCSDHPSAFDRDTIATVEYARQWCYCEIDGGKPCGSHCDSSGCAVFRLKDGTYAVASESSDSSGHG